MLVEAADFMEERFANHQACGGHGRDFPSAGETAGITIHAERKPAHGVIGRFPHSEGNAGMLDRAIFIDEQRAGRADFGLFRVIEEVLDQSSVMISVSLFRNTRKSPVAGLAP